MISQCLLCFAARRFVSHGGRPQNGSAHTGKLRYSTVRSPVGQTKRTKVTQADTSGAGWWGRLKLKRAGDAVKPIGGSLWGTPSCVAHRTAPSPQPAHRNDKRRKISKGAATGPKRFRICP